MVLYNNNSYGNPKVVLGGLDLFKKFDLSCFCGEVKYTFIKYKTLKYLYYFKTINKF